MKSPQSLDYDGLDGVLPDSKAPSSWHKYLIWMGLLVLLLVIILFLFWVKKDKPNAEPIILAEVESPTRTKEKLATIEGDEIKLENIVQDELPSESVATLAIQQIKNSSIITLLADSNNSSLNETKSSASSTHGYSIESQVSSDKSVTTSVGKSDTPDPVMAENSLLTFQFKHSSSEVKALSVKETKRLTDFVNSCDKVVIVGHTCNLGPAAFNYQFGLARATSMRKYLIGQGINPGILTARSEGMNQPVVSNATRVGRKLNRRIEMLCTRSESRSRREKPL